MPGSLTSGGGDRGDLDASGTRAPGGFLGEGIRAANQGLNDLILGNGLDDLAAGEDLSLPLPEATPKSGLARLAALTTQPITATDRQVLQAHGDVLGERPRPPARDGRG